MSTLAIIGIFIAVVAVLVLAFRYNLWGVILEILCDIPSSGGESGGGGFGGDDSGSGFGGGDSGGGGSSGDW
jgi:uncharacterized membrane protein YgcG